MRPVHFRPVGETSAMRGGDQRLLRGVCVGHHVRSGAAIFLRGCEERNDNCENFGAREVGSRVHCNMYWSSLVIVAGSTESGESCRTCGRGRSRCCPCDCDAGSSES